MHSPADKIFHPNDLVTGHVTLKPITPLFPKAIYVTLFSNSSLWHRVDCGQNPTNYLHYRDNAPLFEVSEDVMQSGTAATWRKTNNGPTLLPGQTYNHRFEFRFPARTSNVRIGQYKDDADTRFVVGPHDLPPTFLYTNKHGDGDGTDANFAKVEYGVRARLVCPTVRITQGKGDLVVTIPINFHPPAAEQQSTLLDAVDVRRHSKTFSLQSSVLTGQHRTQIGFRQGLRDRFSSTTPVIHFNTTVEIPDRLLSGSEFCLRTVFTIISRTDSVTHIPAVKFSILKLDLLDFTFLRAPRDWDASTEYDGHFNPNKFGPLPPPEGLFTRDSERNENTERKTHLNSLPESATVELVEVPSYENKEIMEQASSCEAWFTARVPSLTPPGFKSFAISRSYRVKFKLRVEIGGREFQYGAESQVRELGSALV